LGAWAQEVEVEDGEEDTAAAEAPEVSGGGSAASLAASAQELQEKLAQLKGLLEKRADGADPALQERLKGLEAQLKSLNLQGDSDLGENRELHEFLAGCLMMSLRRAGPKRPAATGALRRLASGSITQQEASELEIFRMVAVCVNELTDAEHEQVKVGKLAILPKALAEKASAPEAKSQVMSIEADVWGALKEATGALLEQLGDDSTSQRPPVFQGLLAAVPVTIMVAFLAKKFFDMQNRETMKKDKSAKKKHK